MLCAAWAGYSARVACHPPRHPAAAPSPLPDATVHTVAAADGTSFPVWIFRASTPRARLLVCHGYYADRAQVMGIAAGLSRRGYEAVVFEWRGHGSRPGPFTFGVREREDAGAVLAWLRAHGAGQALPIGILGLSMGAALACQVAERFPDIRAVMTDSIYPRLFPVLAHTVRDRYHLPVIPFAWLTWWGLQVTLRARLAARDPIALAPRLRQPLLDIHGGEDRRASPAQARWFYERWAGPKDRWEEPGVAHVNLWSRDPERYGDRVAAFCDRVLR